MKMSLERIRKALWTHRQPLAHEPASRESTVSDLFVWRTGGEWRTFFELTDICALFADVPEPPPRKATLVVFDSAGRMLTEERIEVVPNERRTIDLSGYTEAARGAFGTFCVFHPHPPQAISDLGSFIAERGYVSYRYKSAPMRSYVHGNFDAIARGPDGRLELLGVYSPRRREYRLQHELTGPAVYEMMIVNPTPRRLSCRCRLFSTGGALVSSTKVRLTPSGCDVFRVEMDDAATGRIVIDSHLVMARPVVFRTHDLSADVFHG